MKVEHLNIGYFEKQGEKSIATSGHFKLEEAELVGVIGINGSGKSTLLRTLAGIQKPLSGNVLIADKSISQLEPKDIAKRISLVLTGQTISKNISVRELVTLGRQPYTNWIGKLSQADKDAVKKAEQAVGISNLIDRSCNELSDGQLQKVLIARALAQNTPYVILDEPTTHLDLHHKSYVLQLLKKLTLSTQKTIIFATHEVNMALDICDKLIVVKNGTIFFGTSDSLIEAKVFRDIFPQDSIAFNAGKKQFSMITK